MPQKWKFYESVGTNIAAASAMSGRRKKLATRPEQSSHNDTSTDIEVFDEIRATGADRVRKPSQKARDNEPVGLADIAEVLGIVQKQMQHLVEAHKRSEEANKRFEEANKQLKDENKELKDLITSLKLDIESMKAYSPH